MRRFKHSGLALAILLLFGGIIGGILVYSNNPAQAQAPDQAYDLSWHVVAGGGGQGEEVPYTLGGTAAEPGAGLSTKGNYTLCAGFWCGPTVLTFEIYLPLLLRNY
jgi:hypothetical protein